ncbi:MAG: laccase domain-containing protein, partial [Acidobacteriaceae bacterium]|nr:laccase domain-containing protein [Acidobacteriaceae bacterium]
ADCVPVLIAAGDEVAAVHAGWRGTASGIASKTARAMHDDFGTKPKEIYAAFGPSIRGCCYEVGPEVAGQFTPLFPEWDSNGGKRKLNLAEANRRQLEGAGVRADHIFDCCLCTTCEPAQFFSFRREPENPGRMVASICRLT